MEKYKKEIFDEFFPARGDSKFKFSVVRNAIRDFKKLCNNEELLGELMVSAVDTTVEFIYEFADMPERLYTRIENFYEQTLKFLSQNNLLEKFKQRLCKMCEKIDGIGYGIGDQFADLYSEYFHEDFRNDKF